MQVDPCPPKCIQQAIPKQPYLQVELVVQVPVDLLGITVLPQKPPEDAQPPHPKDLSGQTGLTGTVPLTYSVEQRVR